MLALLLTTGVTCAAAQDAVQPSVAMLEFLGGWQLDDTDALMATLDLLDEEPQPATDNPAPAGPASPGATPPSHQVPETPQ